MISARICLKALKLATAALVLALGSQFLCAQVDPAREACTPKLFQHSVTVNGSIFKTYQEHDESTESACLEVARAGQVVFRKVEDEGSFSLGQIADPEFGVPGIQPGTDVTGRGHPEMIVSYYSGGAHCCTSILLFELEPQLKLLSTLDVGDSSNSHFERDTQNGSYYFVGSDESFAYWHTDFADSPIQKVILKPVSDLTGNLTFQLDQQQMHRRPPTKEEWQEKYLPQARAAFAPDAAFDNYYAGSALWGQMLGWIYGGESNWAWKLVNMTWPAEKPGKDEFLKEFCGQLSQSKYWPDLQTQFGAPPTACAQGITEAAKKPK